MNPWLLVLTSAAVLYVGGMILQLVFRMLDHAANHRNSGGELSGERDG